MKRKRRERFARRGPTPNTAAGYYATGKSGKAAATAAAAAAARFRWRAGGLAAAPPVCGGRPRKTNTEGSFAA